MPYSQLYLFNAIPDHRHSQGVHWVHVHPQGGEKIILGQIYRGKL